MNSNKDKISKNINEYITEKMIAGASYSFIEKDTMEFHYCGVQGKVEPFVNIPLDESMIYDLASLTKVLGTTTRILQLVEQQRLMLSTKVIDILPDFTFSNIQIQHLLLHTSGLDADFQNKENITKQNVLQRINKTSLCHKDETLYSDLGFILLGMIIETIDHMSLEESFQIHIFKKIKMNQTSYKTTMNKIKYVPTEIQEGRGCIQGIVNDSKAYQMGMIGSAGLFSTLKDLSLFVRSMLFDEAIISNQTKKLLLDTTVNQRTFGWEKPFETSVLYHTGFTGTSICLDFINNKGFVLLTNRNFPKRKNEFLVARKKLVQLFLDKEPI
ncbi:serine hydrolase domain-containing protein [Breznakia pachnodae]|uniref:CubicO group peptidase (Beta-lactamase class C family) n=1 Tax=Breznakia pachnodae TaxID=265178 RepID=A0ABU0DZW2_9FIRM|nr:serine hydrolase domain-containing protein [Breznakia pachnodae]MDQ0360172.1 CubicO group peptidase (beta-lactamase class C family) [Breznakia pachnodae]